MNVIPLINQQNYFKNNQQKCRTMAGSSNISFGSNPNSIKNFINPSDFLINILGYGRDMEWANNIKKITDDASVLIKNSKSSDDVLPYIANNVKRTNFKDYPLYIHSGVLRAIRPNYGETGEWGNIITSYTKMSKYSEYADRLDERILSPLENPYSKADFLTRIKTNRREGRYMAHGDYGYVNVALDYVNDIYKDLHKNYISQPQNVTNESLDDINSKVAEIRWIMAHSTPWERSSDAISNSFMRALYKSMGIKAAPLKEGVTLDLQAYCTELPDYKKNFHSYFSEKPKIID